MRSKRTFNKSWGAASVLSCYLLLWNLFAGFAWIPAAVFYLFDHTVVVELTVVVWVFAAHSTLLGLPYLVFHLPLLVALFRVRARLIRQGRIALLAHPGYFAAASALLALLVLPIHWGTLYYWWNWRGDYDTDSRLHGGIHYGFDATAAVPLAFASLLTSVVVAYALPSWLGDPREQTL